MPRHVALAAALLLAFPPCAQAADSCRDDCARAGKKDCEKACSTEKAKPTKSKKAAGSTPPPATAPQVKATEGGYGLCDR